MTGVDEDFLGLLFESECVVVDWSSDGAEMLMMSNKVGESWGGRSRVVK